MCQPQGLKKKKEVLFAHFSQCNYEARSVFLRAMYVELDAVGGGAWSVVADVVAAAELTPRGGAHAGSPSAGSLRSSATP